MKAKNVELHSMSGLVKKGTMHWKQVAELGKAVAKTGVNFVTVNGSRVKVSAVEEALAGSLPAFGIVSRSTGKCEEESLLGGD